ncbi:MAG: 16S rRNA (uracil(1498)-N(3))-methyltransferase [Oscillospiraceae bacterium]|nr:16S rRNA (uracil(1498)-N(3))-methyltransferase [Oscillospiraceae bacterium]
MPRFFIDENALMGDRIVVTGADAVHMGRSLRMREGDKVTFCRMGTEYECEAESFTSDSVTCRIISEAPSMAEPHLKLTVYQALPKLDKAEYIIQKCTELGASAIVFFESKRCVARMTGDFDKKLVRFERIALEAAKQSGRGIIPAVTAVKRFDDAVQALSEHDMPLICYENGGERLAGISLEGIGSAGVMIGSEGGFDRDEAELAQKKGAHTIWLGKRILRCETAPVAMTAILMNMAGDM